MANIFLRKCSKSSRATLWRQRLLKIFFSSRCFLSFQDAKDDVDFSRNRIALTPDDSSYTRYINDGLLVSCTGEEDSNIKWQNPHGIDVGSKGRVHVEFIAGQLRLIIEKIQKEDQGKWTCSSDNDEDDGKYFTINVNGKQIRKYSFIPNLQMMICSS